ncbi:competence protein CoiA family protein [Leeia oryzae]|uniref:competence protein CoiA family protein n=1 Tax=Leeia oryzae TaxID=356662 RepID=UPI000366AE91|nr:competence protein CoiA family protein [Leeia oryzae]
MDISNPMITFALAEDGRMVHVEDVPTGIDCRCVCPGCKHRLIAKNAGREKAHHFAHETGSHAEKCAETALHQAAKQVVQDYKWLAAPEDSTHQQPTGNMHFSKVILEHRMTSVLGEVIVDCFAIAEGEPIAIEIAVHHKVDEIKTDKLKHLSIRTLEIDLKDMVSLPWTWSDLEEAVLMDVNRRYWVEQEAEPSVPTPQITAPAWQPLTFTICGASVWVDKLPYNYKVKHRFNEDVRKVVEPICRGRGHWEGRYRNWIIFEQFIQQVVSELQACQQQSSK